MPRRRTGSKRGNREGSIYQRSDGRWVAQVALPGDGRGHRRRKTLYGKTREEVRKKLLQAQRSVQDGVPLPSERLTVADFAKEWLESIRSSIRYKTYESY